MASGFFALLDDVATLMDDVATMGKIAGKKTAGLLGDDLAVNAEKASGFMSKRELPVLWAITKGSLLNKLIILPIAFLLSAFVPSAITIILIIGGLYLAYEGAEKIYEFLVPHAHEKKSPLAKEMTEEEILAVEKEKVKAAIITDFILSVEIIIVALGTVTEEPIGVQIGVVSVIALLATVGVYGLVALIVRMDEFGLKLINLNEEDNSFSDKVGRILVAALPKVIKGLSIIGTIALLLVSGGIFAHYVPFIHHWEESIHMPTLLFEFVAGLVIGAVVLLVVLAGKKVWKLVKK
ncbi:membrane protein [Marivirga lumbricoides]|uniref:Membrane protein n=1 Tax=Marivirga lumbricoides TaxID=1046115 RepID=A0ABQ1N2P6_9BACT|nr:membrane protein [Marivirga lumbricoides]